MITTSGTAVGELLPAVMEAYYSGVPLLVISADRPRNFRGTGAPQAAEQVGIFGIYTPFVRDIEVGESPTLSDWQQTTPAQLNICFEEAYSHSFDALPDFPLVQSPQTCDDSTFSFDPEPLHRFFEQSKYPIAIVSTLIEKDRDAVINFLKSTNIPVYSEGPSGIRESKGLEKQRLMNLDKLWERGESCDYPVDGILRIGGVPTTRIWRDLEKKEGQVHVCSISHLPFSGLSWGSVVYTDLSRYLSPIEEKMKVPQRLIDEDRTRFDRLDHLIETHKYSEPSLVRRLSKIIPKNSLLYLGNSLPIRQWDLAATMEDKGLIVEASRGLNGIDGQLSTFLGLADPRRSNWAIVGDLTALYDLSAPWILRQIAANNSQIVVINNGGGKIFSRLFKNEKMQNNHDYTLKAMADLWGLDYLRCEGEINIGDSSSPRIIECIPDARATENFWSDYH